MLISSFDLKQIKEMNTLWEAIDIDSMNGNKDLVEGECD